MAALLGGLEVAVEAQAAHLAHGAEHDVARTGFHAHLEDVRCNAIRCGLVLAERLAMLVRRGGGEERDEGNREAFGDIAAVLLNQFVSPCFRAYLGRE